MENIIWGSGAALEEKENHFLVTGAQNRQDKVNGNKTDNKQGNSIYAGDLLQRQDAVSNKFAQAQKSAIKKLLDQFEADLKIDGDMEASESHIDELNKSICDTYQMIKKIDEQRSEIAERYEMDSDSSLTDYQEEILECDKLEEMYRNAISDNRRDVEVESATIQATKKALLKVHPMVDAQKEADQIMDSAIKEQINGLLQEGVDKLDEDAKKRQEEIAEEQEQALEEKLQREKLKKEEADSKEAEKELQEIVFSVTMQNMSSSQQAIENLQENVKSLIQEQIVLDVDVKGLRVNQQI